MNNTTYAMSALLVVSMAAIHASRIPLSESPDNATTVTAERDCIKPVSRTRRIYRRPNHTLAYWTGGADWARTLPFVPASRTELPDGTLVHEGKLHVRWRTDTGERLARVIPDASHYRIALDDGLAGPAIARQADGQWSLADSPDNYVDGSLVANLVSEHVTVEPRTLQRAAGILQAMKMGEPDLLANLQASTVATLSPNLQATVLIAVGHSFVETLPARLRDPAASVWTPREVRLIGPDVARHVRRPLAVYRSSGALDFAVNADGREIPGTLLPRDTIRLIYNGSGRYRREAGRPGEYASLFAAIEAEVRPPNVFRAMDPGEQERSYRSELAAAIEAAPSRARLERMFQLWIEPLGANRLHKWLLLGYSRLRQALFDRNQPLSPLEEGLLVSAAYDLLPAHRRLSIEIVRRDSGEPGQRLASIGSTSSGGDRIVIEADVDTQGRRTAYYRRGTAGSGAMRSRPILDHSFSPLVDVLLNADNGKLRKILGRGEWDFQQFADDLLARVVDMENSLLPPSLHRLVVNDPAVLADAETRSSDSWALDGRHYVRLRSLDGRTQVVETGDTVPGGVRGVLGYDDGHTNPQYTFGDISEHNGKWRPSPLLRAGFDPLSTAFRQNAAATILAKRPTHIRIDRNTADRIASTTPYPLLLAFMTEPSTLEVEPNGEIVLIVNEPVRQKYRTGIDLAGETTPSAPVFETPPPRPPTPLGSQRTLAPGLRLRGGGTTALPAHDSAAVEGLLASGAPIGDFIVRGVGDKHVQALVNARRLRAMLREDRYMVLVGVAAGHAFTVAMPINAASIQMTGWEARTSVPIANLPEGSVIVDDWYGVSAKAADYPDRVRAIARQWEDGHLQIEMKQDSEDISMLASPSAFTEQLLSTAVQFSVWTPARDPIKEVHYVDYIHRRYAQPRETVRAGLDWLESSAAQSEYSRYFPDSPERRASISSVAQLTRSALDIVQSPARTGTTE